MCRASSRRARQIRPLPPSSVLRLPLPRPESGGGLCGNTHAGLSGVRKPEGVAGGHADRTISSPLPHTETDLAKPNYAFEKRQRELAKKKKQEEKDARKREARVAQVGEIPFAMAKLTSNQDSVPFTSTLQDFPKTHPALP